MFFTFKRWLEAEAYFRRRRALLIFSVVVKLGRELLISSMHNKFAQDKSILFMLLRQQGQIIDVKWEK